ncbi:hypothetical protein EVAR_47267_1 [Eumeta japonica]|uniref:Uncharacterized protein n=1 Tax=Eumeta variegata TaxID=151549 RepID=A0A4C1XHA9_EUMVA|nr:hypothetical protein EVAR_47267_1 [Eumeta japonica]
MFKISRYCEGWFDNLKVGTLRKFATKYAKIRYGRDGYGDEGSSRDADLHIICSAASFETAARVRCARRTAGRRYKSSLRAINCVF